MADTPQPPGSSSHLPPPHPVAEGYAPPPPPPPMPGHLPPPQAPGQPAGPHGYSHVTAEFRKHFGIHRDRVLDDLKVLQLHLLLPIRELSRLSWTRDHKLLAIMALGLFPIAAQTCFSSDPKTVYWCLGFYFSTLWGFFFYHFFQPTGVVRTYAIGAFLGTGVISMTILMGVLEMGLEKLRDPLLASTNQFVQPLAYIFTVGVPEEMTKALVILWILFRGPRLPSLPTMVFYGLMSGLGFGIYEGMKYQMGENFNEVNAAQNVNVGVANYYFDNMLRLTTLPFLHATWTAIGAYFWSLGRMYPGRRHGLWVTALCIPAIFHGLYDTYTDSFAIISLIVAFISVYTLMIYLSSSQKLEHVLQESGAVAPRPTVAPSATMPSPTADTHGHVTAVGEAAAAAAPTPENQPPA